MHVLLVLLLLVKIFSEFSNVGPPAMSNVWLETDQADLCHRLLLIA